MNSRYILKSFPLGITTACGWKYRLFCWSSSSISKSSKRQKHTNLILFLRGAATSVLQTNNVNYHDLVLTFRFRVKHLKYRLEFYARKERDKENLQEYVGDIDCLGRMACGHRAEDAVQHCPDFV